MKHIGKILAVCGILMAICLVGCAENHTATPFDEMKMPSTVSFAPTLSAEFSMTDDREAIEAFVTMLKECRYQECENDSDEEQIEKLQLVDLRNGVCFYLNLEKSILYFAEYGKGVDPHPTKAYEIKGFDRDVFDALYASRSV